VATTLTITDDDTAGTIQFQLSSSAAGEGVGGSIVAVTRSGGAASGATVQYAVTGGTATGGGVDYTLAAGTLTFAASDNQETFTIALVNDTLDEPDETVVITLSSPGGGAVLGAPTVHTFTLADNDDPTSNAGTLRFNTSSGTDVEGPGGEICMTVERNNGSTGAIGVQVLTHTVTATAGSDFVPGPYPLAWGNGDASSRQICVPLVDDTADEPLEFFNLELANATGGAVLGTWSVVTVNIQDDDPAGQLFRDGFESGNVTKWSASVP
jgi:hypothetical protein